MKPKFSLRHFILLASSVCFAASSLQAADGTWNVNAGGNWNDTETGNWLGGIVAGGSGSTANFTMTGTGDRTINVDGDRTIGNITRNWAGGILTISGSPITLAGTNPTITNNNAGGGARMVIGSQILGSDGLNIAGGGYVLLTNNTTNYSGATSITGGSLLSFGGIPLANISGGSGRNISVGAGSSVNIANGNMTNTFLNRIVQTNDEIGVFMSATGSSNFNNNLDFSSAGADLPNAFFGTYSTNGAIARYNGVLTPASDNYRIGFIGSSGALHIMQPLTDIDANGRGLIIGGGTPILAADNTFTGDTVLRDGRLFIGRQLALQNSALNVGNGSDGINGQFVFTNGPGTAAPAEVQVVNAPTIGGLIGSRNLASIYNSGNQNNTARLAIASVLGITLNVADGKTHEYAGNARLSTGMFLTKTGEGTQILSGANDYTGATSVNQGTLILNGSTAAGSAVSVASGATLGGDGTVGGTLNVSGIIAPGNSIGQLNAGATTWNGASSASAATDWKFELGADNAADMLNITGAFNKDTTNGSIFRFDFLGSSVAGVFDLVTWDGGTTFDGSEFSYTGLNPLYTGSFSISGSTLQFTSSVIPEPSTALAGILLGLGLLRRRRSA